MGTFLYFIPKAITTPVQSDDELIAAGLAHVGGVAGGPSNHTMSGPGGVAGAIWSMPLPDGKPGPAPVYRPDAQTWRQHPSKKHWVGLMKDDLPTPDTLRRTTDFIDGEAVKLGDGASWTIPLCVPRTVRGLGMIGPTLPRSYDLDDDGTLIGSVSREYSGLAERCHDYFERFVGWADRPADEAALQQLFQDEVDLAADLIGINYRVGRFEAIAVLRLLGSRERHRLLRTAIEAERIEAALDDMRKKDADSAGSDSTDGATVAAAGSNSATSS